MKDEEQLIEESKGFLVIVLMVVIVIIVFAYKGCSHEEKQPKIAIPLTDQQMEFKESQVSIDTTKNKYSVDGHQLVQYKSDAIMHFSSCRECQKRYNINE